MRRPHAPTVRDMSLEFEAATFYDEVEEQGCLRSLLLDLLGQGRGRGMDKVVEGSDYVANVALYGGTSVVLLSCRVSYTLQNDVLGAPNSLPQHRFTLLRVLGLQRHYLERRRVRWKTIGRCVASHECRSDAFAIDSASDCDVLITGFIVRCFPGVDDPC